MEIVAYFLIFWGVYNKLKFNLRIIPMQKNGFITEDTVGMLHAKQGKQKHNVHQHVRK